MLQLLRTGSHQCQRLLLHRVPELRRLPCRTKGTHGILQKMRRYGTDDPCRKICLSAVGIEQCARRQLHRHRIHRRIAAIEILFDGHRRIKYYIKAAVPRSRLALSACKGDLGAHAANAHMIDGKPLADLLRPREVCTELCFRQPRDNIVHILRRYTADGIADTAANAENVCSCTAHRRHERPLCHAFTSSHTKEKAPLREVRIHATRRLGTSFRAVFIDKSST